MKHFFSYTLLAAFLFSLGSCADKAAINAEDAAGAVTAYLERNPEYENSRFNYGEMTFSSKKEREQLKVYKDLHKIGLIDLKPISQKKKFLSSDSSYTYLVSLTDKARPLVVEQGNDRATVRVFIYKLADEQPVSFKNASSNRAEVTLSLKKEATEFAPVADAKALNSSFVNKTYKLRYDKNTGWTVKN